MLLPKYLLRASGPSSDQNFSESVTYDYSGADEIQKRQDEASTQAAARYKALYDGDIGGSVSAGQRIRDLLSSLGSIQPVRVARSDVSGGNEFTSGAFEGAHDQQMNPPPRMATPPHSSTAPRRSYSTKGFAGRKPTDRKTAAVRNQRMSNVAAGDPQDFSNVG